MALSRFEARRDAVLTEANAIGTTALRARLLPAPYNVDINKLLQEYVRIRLDITQRVPSQTELNAAIKRSNEIQEALWRQTKLVVAKDSGVTATGIMDAMNSGGTTILSSGWTINPYRVAGCDPGRDIVQPDRVGLSRAAPLSLAHIGSF